jgi:thermitase
MRQERVSQPAEDLVARPRTVILSTIITVAVAASYAATTAQAGGPDSTTQVLVKFQPGADVEAAINGVGAAQVGTIHDLGVHVLSVPDTAADHVVAALSRRADVQYAEPDSATQATVTPNDPGWVSEWGAAKINEPAAWDSTTGSSSTVIAVLDSGADSSHPDLQGRFLPGYNFIGNNTNTADDNGHGTAASGVVGATANNGIGMAGACWACQLMPVKVLDANGSGNYTGLANGITWATDHGADVISMSLVGTADSSTLHSAVQYAHNRGVVLVAAAGNAGTTSMTYPASYAEVIGVAGTQSNDTLYSWSSYGSWVKVAAPGCDYATIQGGGYGSFCGTSAATPVVAGVVGLARSLQPGATNTQVETALETSAVKIGSVVAHGRVDAAATLTALGSGSGGTTPTPTPATTTTSTSTFSGSLNGKNASKSFSVTSGAGSLNGSLTFSGTSSLSLQLVDGRGVVLANSSGGSPVTVSATVPAGQYKLVVGGGSKVNPGGRPTRAAPPPYAPRSLQG